jgi:hypothetical protein
VGHVADGVPIPIVQQLVIARLLPAPSLDVAHCS